MARCSSRRQAFLPAALLCLACAPPRGGAGPGAPAEPTRPPAQQGTPGRAGTLDVRAVASGLATPWSLAFAPDGRLFVAERAGRVRLIQEGRLVQEPVATLAVRETAEGGLSGMALDPRFPAEPYLYVLYTLDKQGRPVNRLARLRLEGTTAREDRILLDDIPGANVHTTGRVRFGPDGRLYVSTGDAQAPQLSQNRDSPAGKLLRLERDGSVPADNPTAGSPVYTLGHRHCQGFDWQPGSGRLYATEHGPVGNDEINLLEPGQNYGWPQAQGQDHAAPFRAPLRVYSPSIAPTGAQFYAGDAIPQWRGSFFFTALRGTALYRIVLDPDNPRRIREEERLYQGTYGRLRDLAQGPDGALYLATSNRDGRGRPQPDDDRVLRIGPA